MRHFTCGEQFATYSTGVFTMGDAIPGRLVIYDAAGGDARIHYRAESVENPGIWEIGVGDFAGGDSLTRVQTLTGSSGTTAIDFVGEVRVAMVALASALVAVDSTSDTALLRSAEADGQGAIAMGPGARALGDYSIAIGQNVNVGAGDVPLSGAIGIGDSAEIFHPWSVVLGAGGIQTYLEGGIHRSDGGVWWAGAAYTTDATPALMTFPQTDVLPVVPEGGVFAFTAIVVALRVDVEAHFAAEVKGLLYRASFDGAATIVGTPVVTEIAKTGGVAVSVDVAASGSAGAFGIEVTGVAGQEWSWRCDMRGIRL